MIRTFVGLGSFARFLEKQTAEMVPVGQLGMGAIRTVLYREVRDMFGDDRLTALSEATQADREKKGFTPDDPLLRNGQLLRDSVQAERGPDFVVVGSSEPVAAYHEYGYVNARTGNAVPPRATFREGLRNAIPLAVEITQEIVGVQLGVAPINARLTELSVIEE